MGTLGRFVLMGLFLSFKALALGASASAAQVANDEPPLAVALPLRGVLVPAQGTIEFMFRPNWDGSAAAEFSRKRILFTTDGNEQYGGGVFTIAKWPNRASLIVRVYNWELGRIDTSGWRAGVWHHVAITWDATTVRSFLDGLQVFAKSRPLPLPVGPVPTRYFVGANAAGGDAADGSFRFVKLSGGVSPSLVRAPAAQRSLESVLRGLPEEMTDSSGLRVPCRTDETAKLQCAFLSAAPARFQLIFPVANTYAVLRTLKLPSGLWVNFNGSTLRRQGSRVFTVLEATKAERISLSRLIIDGNRGALQPASTGTHAAPGSCASCFSGLRLVGVTNSYLDVDVRGTVNLEDNLTLQPSFWHAGVYLQGCSDLLTKLHGSGNARTAIFIKDSPRVTVLASSLSGNSGSGISGNNSDDCRFFNVSAHHNGYSQLSINGERCFASGIEASAGTAGYADINIGHSTEAAKADFTVVEDALLREGPGWGVTIVGSNEVKLRDLTVLGHAGANIQIRDSRASSLSRVVSSGSALAGLQYRNYGGVLNNTELPLEGHSVEDSRFFGNACYGVAVESSFSVLLGNGVDAFDNGAASCSVSPAGVLSQGVLTVEGGSFHDTRSPLLRTQQYGLWFAGMGSATLRNCSIHDNKIAPIRLTGGLNGAKPIVSNVCSTR